MRFLAQAALGGLVLGVVAVAAGARGLPPLDTCVGVRQPTSAPGQVLALIEIPAGGRVKYELDLASGRLVADRILPDSVRYPVNYGMIPCTLGGDGDALDALIPTEEPLLPGTLVLVEPVAVLSTLDRGERDDKILALPAAGGSLGSPEPHRVPSAGLLDQLHSFFSTYKGPDADMVVGPWEGPTGALARVREALARQTGPGA